QDCCLSEIGVGGVLAPPFMVPVRDSRIVEAFHGLRIFTPRLLRTLKRRKRRAPPVPAAQSRAIARDSRSTGPRRRTTEWSRKPVAHGRSDHNKGPTPGPRRDARLSMPSGVPTGPDP